MLVFHVKQFIKTYQKEKPQDKTFIQGYLAACILFCLSFKPTAFASPYFRCWLYASPYTRAFTSYSLQTTPFAFPKASLLVCNTNKPRFGCLSQCFVSCETIWPPRKVKHCFTWNAITTITQSLFYRAVTHKALLLSPTISGYASTIRRISTLATYKTNIAGCYKCIYCGVVQY